MGDYCTGDEILNGIIFYTGSGNFDYWSGSVTTIYVAANFEEGFDFATILWICGGNDSSITRSDFKNELSPSSVTTLSFS